MWLAVRTSRVAVSALMRVSWRAVGAMVRRAGREARARAELLQGLRRIGIDEISYRRGQRYLTVVVDHDGGRLVWLAPGRDRAAVARFFEALGPERCRQLELVSADAGAWIGPVVRRMAPEAVLCLDPFHVVQWATQAVDAVRRDLWRRLRRQGRRAEARALQRSRWLLWRAREGLRPQERQRLARLAPCVRLARTVRQHRGRIAHTLQHRLTNARVEACNTQLRLLQRIAHGFRDVEAFIQLAFLKLAGLCPPLPGREPLPMKTA